MEEDLSEIQRDNNYPESLLKLDRSEYIKFRSKIHIEKQNNIDGVTDGTKRILWLEFDKDNAIILIKWALKIRRKTHGSFSICVGCKRIIEYFNHYNLC